MVVSLMDGKMSFGFFKKSWVNDPMMLQILRSQTFSFPGQLVCVHTSLSYCCIVYIKMYSRRNRAFGWGCGFRSCVNVPEAGWFEGFSQAATQENGQGWIPHPPVGVQAFGRYPLGVHLADVCPKRWHRVVESKSLDLGFSYASLMGFVTWICH